MLRSLTNLFSKNLSGKTVRRIHFEPLGMPSPHATPGLTAKRLIQCVGERLRAVDPERWDSVPITWETKWTDAQGFTDLRTTIMVHDAIEREFGIEINDKRCLVTDFKTAWYVLGNSEDGH